MGTRKVKVKSVLNLLTKGLHARIRPFLLALSVLIIAGCTAETSESNSKTQVAAVINGQEITVHQINRVLERRRDVAPADAAEAKRRILDGLINEELAAQKAIDKKLDRSGVNVVYGLRSFHCDFTHALA